MAAFIVISTDNKLHHLVDGIEKCRPRNPHVETYISTGKIIRSESGEYAYCYTVNGDSKNEGKEKKLSDLLSNQFASFRKVCSISKNDLVNVFLLENPLSKDDLKQDEQWLSEFKDVYKEGQGKDTGFRLFRVLFTYDVDNATDVCSQMDATQLKGIIETHHNVIKNINDGERMFDQFLFYIDNQNSDAAALCLTQKEHNLILPRYLADIMMLISNTQDSYGVINAITNTSVCSTRCFSVGYAESMYYYPDVERYIISADQKNLLHECLYTEDNEVNNVDKKVMDVSKYPFGLLKRKKRLGEFYRDVPFSENIENYPQSADKIIDDNIIILKNLIEAKRKEEFNDFEHSEVVEKIRKEIESYKQQMDALISDNTIDDEEHKKKQEVAESKLKQAKILLKDMYNKFQPKCPEYLNRMSIYRSLFLINEEQKESIGKTKSENYKRLLDYVCSEDFLKFVEREETNSSEVQDELKGDVSAVSNEELQNKKGCLEWLFFWKKEKGCTNCIPTEDKLVAPDKPKEQVSSSGLIVEIMEKLYLKRNYVNFVQDIANVETEYSKIKKVCDGFKLTTHSNSYSPLIDLGKLKDLQEQTYKDRFKDVYNEWIEADERNLESIKNKMEEGSKSYAKKFTFIDWNNPFPFVLELSVKDNFPQICNKLQSMASPFVNYNLISSVKEDKIMRKMYTDIPTIVDDFKEMKGSLNNGNEIGVYCSSHMESKICMMQFLPMDDDVLANLVDLQDSPT